MDLAFKPGGGRAGHQHGILRAAGPFDGQQAAASMHVPAVIQFTRKDTGNQRRARPGAAGQRLAGPTLEHAQLDRRARQHLHEAGVDTLRKPHMGFDLRPDRGYRGAVHVRHQLHGVGVTHGHDHHLHLGHRGWGMQGQRPHQGLALALLGQPAGVERHTRRLQHGCAHVDRDAAIGGQRRRDHTGPGLHPTDTGDVPVGLGLPRCLPQEIPFSAPAPALRYPVAVGDETVQLAVVNMGNPHAVLRVADVDSAPGATLGPLLE